MSKISYRRSKLDIENSWFIAPLWARMPNNFHRFAKKMDFAAGSYERWWSLGRPLTRRAYKVTIDRPAKLMIKYGRASRGEQKPVHAWLLVGKLLQQTKWAPPHERTPTTWWKDTSIWVTRNVKTSRLSVLPEEVQIISWSSHFWWPTIAYQNASSFGFVTHRYSNVSLLCNSDTYLHVMMLFGVLECINKSFYLYVNLRTYRGNTNFLIYEAHPTSPLSIKFSHIWMFTRMHTV